MDDQRLLLGIEPGEIRHGRVQNEEAVQRQAGIRPVLGQRDAFPQGGIIGIGHRRSSGQAVQRPAQDDGEQARIARPAAEASLGICAQAKKETPAPSNPRREIGIASQKDVAW